MINKEIVTVFGESVENEDGQVIENSEDLNS